MERNDDARCEVYKIAFWILPLFLLPCSPSFLPSSLLAFSIDHAMYSWSHGWITKGGSTLAACCYLFLVSLVNNNSHDIQWSVRLLAHFRFVGQDIPKSRRLHGRDQPTNSPGNYLEQTLPPPLPPSFPLLSSARNIHPHPIACFFLVSTIGPIVDWTGRGREKARARENGRGENCQHGQAGNKKQHNDIRTTKKTMRLNILSGQTLEQ